MEVTTGIIGAENLIGESRVLDICRSLSGSTRLNFVFAADEVGRGCLAGDVTVAATCFIRIPAEFNSPDVDFDRVLGTIRDSKKLSDRKRRAACASLHVRAPRTSSSGEHDLHLSVDDNARSVYGMGEGDNFLGTLGVAEKSRKKGFVRSLGSGMRKVRVESDSKSSALAPEYEWEYLGSHVHSSPPTEIDRINITEASRQTMSVAIIMLASRIAKSMHLDLANILDASALIIDGSLNIPMIEGVAPYQMVIPGADDKFKSVGAASIIAKTFRDDAMRELAVQYPEFSFDKHKGYGTKAHYDALALHGYTSVHRRSFNLKTDKKYVKY